MLFILFLHKKQSAYYQNNKILLLSRKKIKKSPQTLKIKNPTEYNVSEINNLVTLKLLSLRKRQKLYIKTSKIIQ